MVLILNTLNYGKNGAMKNNAMDSALISVIVATYNWPKALHLVLCALNDQTDSNFEVVIADDGSTQDTGKMIELFKAKANFPTIYLWQEDIGFRLAKARNLGIQQARGEYIIFLDSDCIPQTTFIDHHRQLAENNTFVTGHRVMLANKLSQKILKYKLPIWHKSSVYWMTQFIIGHSNKLLPTLYLSMNRRKKSTKWQGIKGCNLGFWKTDLLKIKGFDESFEGWGYEDSNLVIRMLEMGVRRKSGKFATEVFHLWHKEATRTHADKNYKRLQEQIVAYKKSHKID